MAKETRQNCLSYVRRRMKWKFKATNKKKEGFYECYTNEPISKTSEVVGYVEADSEQEATILARNQIRRLYPSFYLDVVWEVNQNA